MNKFLVRTTMLATASVWTSMALAHHSAAMFDMEKLVTIDGTVKDFQYTNPHSWLVIVAPGTDGKEVEWSFETEGPSTLLRAGIKRSSLSVGDKVSVQTHPMKDGRTAGLWLIVTKRDGTILQPRPGGPPPAAGEKPPAAS